MAFWQILLAASILLSIDCILETALVSALVSYVHDQDTVKYTIDDSNNPFVLDARPGNMSEDGGHVTNAAGGLGFFMGLWGVYMALRLRNQGKEMFPKFISFRLIYRTFIVFVVISLCLSLAALVMTFVVTSKTKFTIDIALARTQVGSQYSNSDKWTPANWYSALLTLPITPASDKNGISNALKMMHAGYYNLIPMFIINFGYCALNVYGLLSQKRPSSKGSYGHETIETMNEKPAKV